MMWKCNNNNGYIVTDFFRVCVFSFVTILLGTPDEEPDSTWYLQEENKYRYVL